MGTKSNRMDGDVAIITGTGSGLNRGVALEFARNGCVVMCCDINDKANQETVDMIRQEGGEAYAFHLDTRDRAACKKVGEEAFAIKNKLTILINGAGVGSVATLEDTPDEEYDRVMDINLRGYFNMVMIVDLSEPACLFAELQTDLNRLGEKLGVQIRIQKSEIFEAMHQI